MARHVLGIWVPKRGLSDRDLAERNCKDDLLDVVLDDRFKQILDAIWEFKVVISPITSSTQ